MQKKTLEAGSKACHIEQSPRDAVEMTINSF